MRARFPGSVIVVASVLIVAGCRSGGGSGSPFASGRKSAVDATAATQGGPQLPSASATPANASLAATAAAGTSPFADPGAGGPAPPSAYANQAAAYDSTLPGGYGSPPMADHASAATAQQQGPYSEASPSASASPAPGYPSTAAVPSYPATATPAADPYGVSPGGPAAGGYPAPAATSPGGAYGSVEVGQYQQYQAHSAGSAGGYADNRLAAVEPPTAQAEQSAADRYASSSYAASAGTASAAPSPYGEAEPMAAPADGYRPGSTGYTPGQTGYSPPGVAAYQMPGQPNVVAGARTDPYYRPGGTSDFVPGGQTPSTASSTNRYDTPPIGYGHADPYAR